MKEYIVRVYENRTEWFNSKGQLHRENGSAYEWADGAKSWWLNGKLHREDGPAVEHTNGDKSWYINGKRHREDGPAIEYASGVKGWRLNGKFITEAEFNARMNPVVEMTVEEISKLIGQNIKIVKG